MSARKEVVQEKMTYQREGSGWQLLEVNFTFFMIKFFLQFDSGVQNMWVGKKTFEYYVSQTNELSSDFHVFH